MYIQSKKTKQKQCVSLLLIYNKQDLWRGKKNFKGPQHLYLRYAKCYKILITFLLEYAHIKKKNQFFLQNIRKELEKSSIIFYFILQLEFSLNSNCKIKLKKLTSESRSSITNACFNKKHYIRNSKCRESKKLKISNNL